MIYEVEKEILKEKKEEKSTPDSISTVNGEKIPYKDYLIKKENFDEESK